MYLLNHILPSRYVPEEDRVLRDEVREFQNIAGRNISGINTWSAPV